MTLNDPTGKLKWEFASPRLIIEGISSEYENEMAVLNEYYKNVEWLGSKEIRLDMAYKEDKIVMYSNVQGCDAEKLDEIRQSVAKSSKGRKYKGVGILSFPRIASKMVLITRKDGTFYFMEAEPHGDDFVTTPPTRVGPQEMSFWAKEMNTLDRLKWKDGSITILEGVGKYRSNENSFEFDMKEVFSSTDFERWFQRNKCWEKSRLYFVKYGSKGWKKLDKKIGRGKKRLQFTFPSKEYPAEELPGRSGKDNNLCEYNHNWYRLKVSFDTTVSQNNSGEIRVFVDEEDGVPLHDVYKGRSLRGTVYFNPDYRCFIEGTINLKLSPCPGSEAADLYTQARGRMKDIERTDLGNKLANFLIYADQQIFRPEIENIRKKRSDQKNDRRCNALKNFMDSFFIDNRQLVEGVIKTANTDPVEARNETECPRCHRESILRRGKSTETGGQGIYQLSDKETEERIFYRCGFCGHVWSRERRPYFTRRAPGEKPKTPIYHPSGKTEPRKRRHGFGYSYQIHPFDRNDTRRTALLQTMLRINEGHPDFRALENDDKNLELYIREQAIMTILEQELKDEPPARFVSAVRDFMASMNIHASNGGGKKPVEIKDEPEKKPEKYNGTKTNTPITKAPATVEDLANHMGAKLTRGK